MSTIEKTIDVDVPVRTVYDQWTQFESFPEFMEGVESVQQVDDKRLHWKAQIAGVTREWDAEIVDQSPDQRIAWHSTNGATNSGTVSFAPSGSGTRVTLCLEFEPEGIIEKVGDTLNVVDRRAEGDLERFKTFIEARGTETGAWRGEISPGADVMSDPALNDETGTDWSTEGGATEDGPAARTGEDTEARDDE